ncbi:MAG: alpha/beta fold hydrolase [Bradyrhizobiaceae bacterium]|nr:alpha/beta fold hydrolase [Bradyrhizobiaceae bacterium]
MFTSLGSHKAYFDLFGPEKGPVVCLVHSLATDSGMWAEQIPVLLESGYRVLRVDIRGHGGSDAPAAPYTMKELSDDIAKLLDVLGIDKVHFVGLSIGGMIGQGFALDHPGKVRSLTICDALPGSPPNAKDLWAPRINAVTEAKSLAPVAGGTIERWLSAEFKQKNAARWQQIYDTIVGTKPEGFIGCALAITDFNFVDRLPSVKAPSLVICGANDPGAPPAVNKQIASAIPGGRYEEIADALHFPNVEQPAVFNRIMRGWLDGLR